MKNRYGFKIPAAIKSLINDSVSYPLAYSPTDSTLPFAASIASGMMVSQHGVGDYSKNADGFENSCLNSSIDTLPHILNNEGFKTLFGATGGRFSSKIGFARGYDSHYHSFKPFKPSTQPDFNWVFRNVKENFFFR